MIDGLENGPVQHATNSALPETSHHAHTAHQTEAGSLTSEPEEPSLEALMQTYKKRVNDELAAVQFNDNLEALKEANATLIGLTELLLDQNAVLVSSLTSVAREGESRAGQMQKRLRESAQATKDAVVSMNFWSEEMRALFIRKLKTEINIHEAETRLFILQTENQSLMQYNENLWHDIESLLTIIKEARTSGNWEMDFVTFCEIPPEAVFGPICRLSAKHLPDAFLRQANDSCDDLMVSQQPLAKETASHEPGCVDSMNGLQSPKCSSDDTEQGIVNGNAPSSTAESLKEHFPADNEVPCLSKCSDLTPAVDTPNTLYNGFTERDNEFSEKHFGGSRILEQEQSQCGLEKKSQGRQLGGAPPSRARFLLDGLHGSQASESHRFPGAPVDSKRALCESSPLARDLGCSHVTALSRTDCAAQTEEKEASSVVMSTQTDFLLEMCLPSGNETRDQELVSLSERLNLAIREAQSKTLLVAQLQAHLDTSTMQVELRDQALQNLEKKLAASRADCDNLKKDMRSVHFELQKAEQTIQRERTLCAQFQAQATQLTLTVQHLQEALVNSKRATEETRQALKDASLSRVHDI